MMRSMFAAISGLKVHQTMLDVTSNDIANVNTLGFKGQRTTFKDSLAQLQRGGAAPNAAQGGSNAASACS
jgi:flagellar hook protein FlgE